MKETIWFCSLFIHHTFNKILEICLLRVEVTIVVVGRPSKTINHSWKKLEHKQEINTDVGSSRQLKTR